VARSCQRGNEFSGSIKANVEFVNQLIDYQLLKDSAPVELAI